MEEQNWLPKLDVVGSNPIARFSFGCRRPENEATV